MEYRNLILKAYRNLSEACRMRLLMNNYFQECLNMLDPDCPRYDDNETVLHFYYEEARKIIIATVF